MLTKSRVLPPVILLVVLFLASPAGAQVAPDGDAHPDAPAGATLTLNNLTVQLLLGFGLPVVIAFLQRASNPGWVKVVVAGAVTALAVGISETVQADGSAILSVEFLVDYLITLATAIVAYIGIWNPVAESRGGINVATGSGVMPQVGSTPG